MSYNAATVLHYNLTLSVNVTTANYFLLRSNLIYDTIKHKDLTNLHTLLVFRKSLNGISQVRLKIDEVGNK